MNDALPYIIRPAEPGAQVELYLPKKSLYQGKLYETLTKGFNIDHVRDHFRDPDKRPRIERLLQGHGFGMIEPDKIVQTYWGYSMYEMDGVFKTSDPNRRGQIDEERVQVIRIIFRPDIEEVLRIQPNPLRLRQLVTFAKMQGIHQPQGLEKLGPLSLEDRQVLELIGSFLSSVRLFVVGYLLFEICNELERLSRDVGQKLEDEIWVTLFPEMLINRFIVPNQTRG